MTVKMTVELLLCNYRKGKTNLFRRREAETEERIMKTKFRHKIVAMTLAMMMSAAPVWGAAFAADEFAAEQPDKPVAESYKDNDKIEDYNKKVDEYNKAAEDYNKSVDKEYAAAVEETNAKNAVIDQQNEAELQRVREAEERNSEAQKAADEENAKIAAENQENERLVSEHNAKEDELVAKSEAARNEALAKNEEAAAHNEAVDKYMKDLDQYQKDLNKYNKDLYYQGQILARGYENVAAYNKMIETKYNGPAKASVEKNKSTKKVTSNDLYRIEEAEVKSGRMVKVHIEHNFIDVGMTIEENFEIDENDVLFINSVAAGAGSSTQPGYASFYYNTDEAHSMGYWIGAGEIMMDNAVYKNWNWNCGGEYEISYKDGTNHPGDITDIDVYYDYMWTGLKTYATFDEPVAPTAPVKPESLEKIDSVEVPELYTANYKVYEGKPYVQAVLENIVEANIIERLAEPVRKAYIEYLDHMSLFDAPEMAAPAAAPKAEPKAEAKKAAPAAAGTQTAAPAADTELIAEQEVPMAAVPATITDSQSPLAANGSWALLNLIMTIITGIISAVLLVGIFGKNEEENEEGEEVEIERKRLARLMSLIPAIGAAIIFIITEDMSNPMVLVDGWTILMAVILLIQAVVAMIAKKSKDENEDDEMATINA